MKREKFYRLGCPFCGTVQEIPIPGVIGGAKTGSIRPLCGRCGRMFLVTYRVGLCYRPRRVSVFPL